MKKSKSTPRNETVLGRKLRVFLQLKDVSYMRDKSKQRAEQFWRQFNHELKQSQRN